MKLAWLSWAEGEVGQAEVPGAASNPRIIEYRKLAHVLEADPHEDSTLPWCAVFVNAALESVGVQGSHSGLAVSFARSNDFIQLAAPALGCIVVFWRQSRKSGLGHVGFYLGEDAMHIATLGGNQGDKVSIAKFPKAGATMGHLGYFWPKHLSPPEVIGALPLPDAPETGAV